MLCQLSYGPRFPKGHSTGVKRTPLGALFVLLAAGFGAVAVFAALAGGSAWVIAATAGVLAAWMGDLAFRMLR